MRSTPLRRKHRLLEHDLALGALVHPPADRRIFAFGVLADDDEIDVAGRAVGERRGNARHQPAGPQVDVLVEAAAKRDERAPQRDVIGHGRRPADRAEEDRVQRPELRRTSPRASCARASRSNRSSSRSAPLEADAEPAARGLEHAHAFGHHFLADAIAGNDGDAVRLASFVHHWLLASDPTVYCATGKGETRRLPSRAAALS